MLKLNSICIRLTPQLNEYLRTQAAKEKKTRTKIISELLVKKMSGDIRE